MHDNSKSENNELVEIIKDLKEEILKLKITEDQRILNKLRTIPLNSQEEVKNGQTRT